MYIVAVFAQQLSHTKMKFYAQDFKYPNYLGVGYKEEVLKSIGWIELARRSLSSFTDFVIL